MVYTGLYLGGGDVIAAAPQHVWAGLAVASGVAVVGITIMGCTMNPSHRHTFYRPCSLRKLLGKLW